MKNCKNMFKFIIAIALLIVIPLVPLTVSKIQDDQLVGHLQVEKIKNEQSAAQISKLSVAEKLELIIDYENRGNNIITTTQVQDMNDENIQRIKTIINEQLETLKSLGILTNFNFDENYVCYNYTLKRYSHVSNSQKNVSVYQVDFTNGEDIFNVMIDADTHLIYQYNYYNKKYNEETDKEVYIFGRKYLGLSEKEIQKYLFKLADNYMYATGSSSNWYNLDASFMIEAYRKNDRKSLRYETIKEKGHLIRQGFLPRLHYLEIIDQNYCEVFKWKDKQKN